MTEDGEFGVQTNKVQWKSTYDNLWNLKFTPDNRCVALTSSLGVWTVTVDQESWPEEYEYIWSLMCAGSEHVLGGLAGCGRAGACVLQCVCGCAKKLVFMYVCMYACAQLHVCSGRGKDWAVFLTHNLQHTPQPLHPFQYSS